MKVINIQMGSIYHMIDDLQEVTPGNNTVIREDEIKAEVTVAPTGNESPEATEEKCGDKAAVSKVGFSSMRGTVSCKQINKRK
jgi:hypothetical protein